MNPVERAYAQDVGLYNGVPESEQNMTINTVMTSIRAFPTLALLRSSRAVAGQGDTDRYGLFRFPPGSPRYRRKDSVPHDRRVF